LNGSGPTNSPKTSVASPSACAGSIIAVRPAPDGYDAVLARNVGTVWTAGVLMMPLTYRTFGFDLSDAVFMWSPKQWAEHRLQREENINPEGTYDPGWRENRGLPPLDADWDGEVDHLLPGWTSIPLSGGLLLLAIAGRRKLRDRTKGRFAADRVLPLAA
jgi:hypothetical protein